VDPVPGKTWAIGDKDWDHLFSADSIFFRKTASGKFKQKSEFQFEFGDFRELISETIFEK
jgi:hypothetical protein